MQRTRRRSLCLPKGPHEWQAPTDIGLITLKPFLDIGTESYSAYQNVLWS